MTRGARTIIGVFAVIALIAVWALVIAALANFIAPWPIWGQSIFYLVAGLAWLLPLRPLLVWMNKE
ncbi:MAG: DUF2842 domain-containing protein [Pseudomonadota bacterium]|nr:DUF2842 domain-containing protein [Pseudomonadota bacterium]